MSSSTSTSTLHSDMSSAKDSVDDAGPKQSSPTHTKSHHHTKTSNDAEKTTAHGPSGQKKPSHFRLVYDRTLITDAVLNYPYKGDGTPENPYIVEYLPEDARNPMTWATWRKWFITMLVAVATLAVAFVSSAYSGGVEQIIAEFGCSSEVATLGISLFVLGFAVGPLLWAPLSELYGRQYLFAGTYMALTAFNAGAAGSQNMATLLVLRFFAGLFGSSPLTNAGGVIADMFPANQRGLGMSIFAAAPFLGPTIGPIVGGFVGETVGWRWVEGVMAIFTGVLWIVNVFLVPETYSPVILRERATAMEKLTGKSYLSVLEKNQGKVEVKAVFKKALLRPWALLFTEPIVLLISIYMAIVYGTLYMLFGAFPIVYQQYRGWSPGIGGLAFLGVAVGMILGVIYSIFDNKRYARVEDKHNGEAPPEARLPPTLLGSVMLPIGMFWFAWTNSPSIPWIVSIIGSAPFGFGMVLVFLGCMNYLIDSYVIYAASVLAANSVLRSLFGAAFPLFTTYMYQNLGIHWASSIPAFLALACVPFPFIFYWKGEQIRLKCKYAREAHEIMAGMIARQRQKEAEARAEEEESEKLSRTSTRASRAEQRAEQEDFGKVYSHASHHHF